MPEHVHVFTFDATKCVSCETLLSKACCFAANLSAHQWGPPKQYSDWSGEQATRTCYGCHASVRYPSTCQHIVDLDAVPDVLDRSGNWHWCAKCGEVLVSRYFQLAYPLVVQNHSMGRDYPIAYVDRAGPDEELTPGKWTLDGRGVYMRCLRRYCGRLLDVSRSVQGGRNLVQGGRICVICSHCDGHYFLHLEGQTVEDKARLVQIAADVSVGRIPR